MRVVAALAIVLASPLEPAAQKFRGTITGRIDDRLDGTLSSVTARRA